MATSEDIKFKKLKDFNLVMGFLHLFQGALMLWLATPGKAEI